MSLYSTALSQSEVLAVATDISAYRGLFAFSSTGQSNTPTVTIVNAGALEQAVSNAAVVNFQFANGTQYGARAALSSSARWALLCVQESTENPRDRLTLHPAARP